MKKEIAYEQQVLSVLDRYYQEADALAKWELLESAQEKFLLLRKNPDYTRPDRAEMTELINKYNLTYRVIIGAEVIQRDIIELRLIATHIGIPDLIRDVIQETTAPANVQQLDFQVMMSGAKDNTTNAPVRKYTLKHNTEAVLGKKLRLGTLLHELTHISNCETFGNTVIMFRIKPSATDQEMLNMARTIRFEITNLATLIDNADDGADGLKGLKSELKDKNNYPICGKMTTYLTNFREQLGDAASDRFLALCNRMDCELLEYDSVLNQMMLWCYLSKVDSNHAVYAELRRLALAAYNYRRNYRGRHRVYNPLTGVKTQRV